MASRIIYVPFDHLHRGYGALKNADPKTDVIAFVESARMTTGRNWHPERLFFLISSARHFAKSLEDEDFTVEYIKAGTTVDGLKAIQKKHKDLPMICAEPSSFRQFDQLKAFGVTFVPNDFFLTPRELFTQWAEGQKSYLMENFYRAQRIRLGIMVEGNKPTGGAWNFDKENRLPPPKKYEGPAYLEHKRDEIDEQVAKELGHTMTTTWATTRKGALAQMGQEGAGILLYLNQEGRGIGLANKMRAYALQSQGFDTVEANHRLGFEDDERDFQIGAELLKSLGFLSIRLMTNNPNKVARLQDQGLMVTERVPLVVGGTAQNRGYLRTKAEKSGHLL